ncbi:hypothetical protein Gpo141_00008595 [Globisporangium polare]
MAARTERGAVPTASGPSTAALDAATHAGVAVLGSRALWDVVTSFMAGYPLAVHTFYQTSDPTTLQIAYGRCVGNSQVLVGSLTRRGLLPHLAIAANDPEMLARLLELSNHPQYQRDRQLSFKKVMRCAVLLNRVDMLIAMDTLRAGDPDCEWEPNLMRVALEREDPDLQVLDWLVARVPLKTNRLFQRDMILPITQDDVECVRWLHEHKLKISKLAIDRAAKGGHVDVLRYFYEHSGKRCNRAALDHAAGVGDLEVVRLIVANQAKEISQNAINWAAAYGRLDVVKYLVESNIQHDTPYAIDSAAAKGNLDVVKYLHEVQFSGCTARAMHDAAVHGHLEVVKFLHANRTEGCCPDTLDRAVRNGHLEIVKFLHEHYALECTTGAFDRAATNGHLDVIKFLFHERGERCTASATSWAAKRGHYDVVKFLCEQNLDADIVAALKSAASRGHLEIAKLLHPRLQSGESAYDVLEVAMRQHRPIVKFLCENQERESVSFLQQAVAKSSPGALRAVWQYASVEELVEAQTSAVHQNSLDVAALLEKSVWIKRRKASGQAPEEERRRNTT